MHNKGSDWRTSRQNAPGSGRGARGYNRGRVQPWRPLQQTEARSPAPPLGPVLQEFKVEDLLQDDVVSGVAKITDCRYVASFNWVDSSEPKIIVPGMPPAWQPLDEPIRLKEDSGDYFRDPNAARCPDHPIEPAVRAILAQHPDFLMQNVDVFACGNTMGNLMRFVRNQDGDFRFVVEAVGNTVFFVRRENAPDERIPNVKGYGHAFPENYTQWKEDVAGSVSHQRMITYTFGGKKFIIRSEADGYLPDELADGEGSNSITVDIPTDMTSLSMHHAGATIPQSAIFDLKTRSVMRKGEDHLDEHIQRFWVNQTPNLILAFHDRGLFSDIRVESVRFRVEAWEHEYEKVLQRLSNAVDKTVAFVKSTPDGRCEVRRSSKDSGVLEIRDVGGEAPSALPGDLRKRWASASTADLDGPSLSPEMDEDPGEAPVNSDDSMQVDGE
ncbi:hypothetical protein LTR37_012696 [Vermiconidia calcicola]|uniref:Uncharacterized protein n=1 Tax=Vermiconidia calcicola TaxID=1690605 RepID=A0ACC3MYH9_9PEZI|nr:hypothetical protein LTR37_012696 [Vermiconidia calcicola]